VEGNLRGERHPRRKSEVVDLATTARIRYRTSCKLRREKEGKPVTEHRKQPSNLIIALVRRQILLSLVELVTAWPPALLSHLDPYEGASIGHASWLIIIIPFAA